MNENAGTTATSGDRERFASLADDLVRAFTGSGTGTPAMPPGRRDELLALLVRSMVDGETLDAYAEQLERARTARGFDMDLPERPCGNLPEEEVARRGFGVLPDDQLTEIALDPSALRALTAYLWGELDQTSDGTGLERGDWWWAAVSVEGLARPGLVPGVVATGGAEPGVAREEKQILPFEAGTTGNRSKAVKWLRPFAAVEASLLLGVFLGRTAFERSGEAILAAGASPLIGPGRGTERDLSVRYTSPLSGFATVVALAPGRPTEVYPALGRDVIRVDSDSAGEFGPLPAGTREALVIVSETPAADPVRWALRELAGSLADGASLRDFLEGRLQAKGYRRFALGAAEFPAE